MTEHRRGSIRLIERRATPATGTWSNIVVVGGAIIAGVLLGSLLFLPFDVSAWTGFETLLREGFMTRRGIGDALVKAAPLIFVGLGTIITWRSGFFFLGFQGCLLLGAAGAALVALAVDDGDVLGWLPRPGVFVLTLLAAFTAAALWSGIVGYLTARHGGNEVLLSLMMNFVAFFLINFLTSGPMRAEGALPQTDRFAEKAHLGLLLGADNNLHAGFLVALILLVAVAIMMRYSMFGYSLVTMGLNRRAARYGGIDLPNRTILASLLGGGVAGLAGWSQVLGVQYRLLDGLDTMTGFEGIVAALLGGLTSIGLAIAAVLLGGLSVGAQVMQRRTGVPASVAFMLQGFIVLLILASVQLRFYRIRPWGKKRRSPPNRGVGPEDGGVTLKAGG